MAEVCYEIGARLELPWMIQQVTALPVKDSWQAQARETFRDDIERQQMALTASVMKMESGARDTAGRVDQWLKHHESMHKRWCRLINEVDSGAQGGFPLFAVAVRELVDLAESNSEV